MSGKIKTNVDVVMRQAAYNHPALLNLKDDQRILTRQGYAVNDEERYYAQCDNYGRVSKLLITDNNGNAKVSVFYKYNTNGDLVQEIQDADDDGRYEIIRDYECKYNKNNKLVSHEETFLSELRNIGKEVYRLSIGQFFQKHEPKPKPKLTEREIKILEYKLNGAVTVM